MTSETVDYIVREIDLRRWSVGLFLDDAGGKPLGSLREFDEAKARTDRRIMLAVAVLSGRARSSPCPAGRDGAQPPGDPGMAGAILDI